MYINVALAIKNTILYYENVFRGFFYEMRLWIPSNFPLKRIWIPTQEKFLIRFF